MNAMHLPPRGAHIRYESGLFSRNARREAELPEPGATTSALRIPSDRCRDLDMALVSALVAGDGAAWSELQQRYDRLLVRCITKVTKRFPAASQDDVREIYAQFFLSLLVSDKAKLRAFDPTRGSRLSSYLGMLAMRCAYDWLRNLRREPPREPLGEATELASDRPDPFEAAAQNERTQMAARVMAGFSERDRTFAALYFGEGMEPHQIARSMKISVKTVYSKKHKIKARLESIVALLRCRAAA